MLGNHILVVDDEPNIRRSLTFVLEKGGYQVSVAEDGEQAMTKIRDFKPTVLILDVMMPNKSRYDVCREVKSDPVLRDIHVVILTAKGQEGDQEMTLTHGAGEYISKPFSPIQILTKMKDEFISTVSHELRIPLRSIKGAAQILLSYREQDPATQVEFLSIIDNESDRLTRLINDMLDLSRIESGEMRWKISQLNVKGVIETAVLGTQALTVLKNVKVEVASEEGLPSAVADPDKLVQVITSLLSNAVKFTPNGGLIRVQSRLQAGPRQSSGYRMVEISISDNGVGILKTEFDKIFGRFQQAGTSPSDRTQGTGLGLAISKEIVTHLGGQIWVESELGKGSTFFFTVPTGSPSSPVADPADKTETEASQNKNHAAEADLPSSSTTVSS